MDQNTNMASKMSLATIGFGEKQATTLKSMLQIYTKRLNESWVYSGDTDAGQVVNAGMVEINDNVLIVDIDSEQGKRAWYIAQAFNNDGSLIAFTENPQKTDAPIIIKKSLFFEGEGLVTALNTNWLVRVHPDLDNLDSDFG